MKKHCAGCYRMIIPNSNQLTTSLMGDDYHIACLNCAKCTLPLWGKPFVKKKDGKLYCEEPCDSINHPPKMSKTYYSNIFYNNEIDPNDRLFMLNQTTTSPLVMPLVSPRFNLMNNLIYENPYLKQQQQQSETKKSNNLNPVFNYNQANDYLQKFSLQEELDKAFSKNSNYMNKLEPSYNYNNNNINNKIQDNSNELNSTSAFNFSSLNLQNSNEMTTKHVENSVSPSLTSIASSALSKNQCFKCKRKIENPKEKQTFEDRSYHKNCYKCDQCNNDLSKMKKVMKGPNDVGTYCEPCYYNKYGPKCAKCYQVVMPYMLNHNHNNKLYHRECFVCQWCKKVLTHDQFVDTGKMFICKQCY